MPEFFDLIITHCFLSVLNVVFSYGNKAYQQQSRDTYFRFALNTPQSKQLKKALEETGYGSKTIDRIIDFYTK